MCLFYCEGKSRSRTGLRKVLPGVFWSAGVVREVQSGIGINTLLTSYPALTRVETIVRGNDLIKCVANRKVLWECLRECESIPIARCAVVSDLPQSCQNQDAVPSCTVSLVNCRKNGGGSLCVFGL